jgi:DUF1680 family protein
MELCFYNAVMTGMSTSGTQFTYVNQLASTDTDLSKRAEWFTCACCELFTFHVAFGLIFAEGWNDD